MVALCSHIHAHGEACASPAMHGQKYCFHHQPGRAPSFARRPTARPGYRWYSLGRSISAMCPEELSSPVAEIFNAILENRIAHRRTAKLLRRVDTQIRRYQRAEKLQPLYFQRETRNILRIK